MKKLIIALTVVFCTLGTYAQDVKDSKVEADSIIFVDDINEVIDKNIPTLEAAWAPVDVEHSFGLRFGWGMGMIRREPARQGVTYPDPLWAAGISYRFDVPVQKYVGTIMFELQYVQKGFAYNEVFDGKDSYARSFDVIELPILWQPYLPLDKKGSRIYLNAGPFISYTLSSKEKWYNNETGEIKKEQDYDMDPNEDYFWNYGIAAGLGFYVNVAERWSITADGRYSIQLSDIQRGPEFIPGNPFRTPVDHISVSVGVQYKFSLSKGKKENKNK